MSRGYGRVQRAILAYLRENGSADIAELAAACQSTSSNVHRAVHGLPVVVEPVAYDRLPNGWPRTFVSEFVHNTCTNSLSPEEAEDEP